MSSCNGVNINHFFYIICYTVFMAKIRIISGDITQFEGDAIVNAANESLLGGGGVDGAIHRAAGTELLKECVTLGGCRTGEAKITKGYKLNVKYVIHTVGPVYYEHLPEDSCELLKSCYKNSIALAQENDCKKVAFPLISAGVYGYPREEALKVAVEILNEVGEGIECTIVLFDREAYKIAKEKYNEITI